MALCVSSPLRLGAEGIPEPGLVMYGVVQSVQGGVTNRLTNGTLVCQITPQAGGAPITLTTNLQDLNGRFSYILYVPFESRIPGLNLTAGTLELKPTGATYLRQTTVNGTPATPIGSATTFSFAPADRAIQEQLNVVLNQPPTALDPAFSFTMNPGTLAAQLPQSNILAGFTDPESNRLFISGFAGVTPGVTVSSNADKVLYLRYRGLTNDSFGVVVSDGMGGSVTGRVGMTVLPNGIRAAGAIPQNGEFKVSASAIPNYWYEVMSRTNLTTDPWKLLAPVQADAAGNVNLTKPLTNRTEFFSIQSSMKNEQ